MRKSPICSVWYATRRAADDPRILTWLLTYAVHGALFAALAAVAERTRWGAVASRRDAFWLVSRACKEPQNQQLMGRGARCVL